MFFEKVALCVPEVETTPILDGLPSSLMTTERQRLANDLRAALARYKGGRFEAGGSGGAGGMVFYFDREGRQFYIGGFNPPDAERIVSALNLTLRLLDRPETSSPSQPEPNVSARKTTLN